MRFTLTCVLLALSSASCSFDINRIYEHDVPSVTPPGDDAGADAGADAAVEQPLPASLNSLWKDETFVTDACAKCAKAKCGEVDKTCRADENCVDLTRCVAKGNDPETLAACRAKVV